jgi:hypothetical protein
MPQRTLRFFAEQVGTDTTEYTPDFVVHLIAFGTGDPEAGGQQWNFSRSSDDDRGVCTVREIQQAVVYGGIERFRLHRSGVECAFDAKTSEQAGVSSLQIAFKIDDKAWAELTSTASVVFRGCSCFTLEDHAEVTVPVVEYARSEPKPRTGWRRRLTVVAACASIGVGLFLSYPAFATAQWLDRARDYRLDPNLIARAEEGQRWNIKLAAAAWSVLGAAWASYCGYRRYTRAKRRDAAPDRGR